MLTGANAVKRKGAGISCVVRWAWPVREIRAVYGWKGQCVRYEACKAAEMQLDERARRTAALSLPVSG